ncbi:MAG: hypothetical protein ACOYD6_05925 [Limnochordia bacterium]|jgi:hypothetical protein
MAQHYVYCVYTGLLALLLLAVVPRRAIRSLAIFGVLCGGVVDATLILLMGSLQVVEYINYGPFGYGPLPFFPLIAWTVFFYFLPRRTPWIYIYIIVSAAYCVLFANVLVNLDILRFYRGRLLVPFLIYLPWLSLATWFYLKYGRDEDGPGLN